VQPGPLDLSMAPDVIRCAQHLSEVSSCTVYDCEAPSRVLTSFHGTAIVFDRPLANITPHSSHDIHSSSGSQNKPAPKQDGTKVLHRISLGINELLVSTSVIASMPYTFAVVVYTGNEAKIHRCRRPVPVKWSVIDRLTNRFAIAVFMLQWAFVIALTVVSAVQSHDHLDSWYLKLHDLDWPTLWVYRPIRFFLLLSIMVPLSVNISELIEWDVDLYDEQTDTAASVNSRALTEELGLVQFVMADKTGTLTENSMRLRRIAFATHQSTSDGDADHGDDAASGGGENNSVKVFSIAPDPAEESQQNSPAKPKAAAGGTKHAHFEADPEPHIDVSMREFGVPDSPLSSPGRDRTRPPPPKLSMSKARRLLENEPMALHLAYAIAMNNSCEVSTEQIHTGNLSRQNSKGSGHFEYSHSGGDTPPPPVVAHVRTSSSGVNAKLRRSYASTSPDEVALVEAISKHLNFVLLRRAKRGIALRYPKSRTAAKLGDADEGSASTSGVFGRGAKVEHWTVVGVVPFSSDRGLMTVFLQDPETEEGVIYVKGSDERVLPLCTSQTDGIARAVDDFAADGLRTLVFAMRRTTPEWTNAWKQHMATASALTDVEKRQETVKSLQRELERPELEVVGATGVEDELQAEVPEAIKALRKANMRVWMLTGDKHMTAVQTGRLSGLLKDEDRVLTFAVDPDAPEAQQRNDLALAMDNALREIEAMYDGDAPASLALARESYRAETGPDMDAPLLDVPATTRDIHADAPSPVAERRRAIERRDSAAKKFREGLQSMLRTHAEPIAPSPVPYAVVVTGRSLELITRSRDLEDEFFPIIGHAATVVCCRVTPDQKAKVVSMMRRRGALCLAIGDGGNDVAMIQEADVGIGITGKEGRQAAQAADFNIAKFRFLQPLLFCHGHTAVMRSAYLVQYTFYKSIILALIQAYYNAFFALSSGVSYFDSFALTMYNGCFTVVLSMLPVLDTHLPRSVLRRHPRLYTLSQSGGYMNRGSFNWFIARGIVHSLVIFVLATYIWDGEFAGASGRTLASVSTAYTLPYCALVLVQCMIVGIEFHSITGVHAFFIPFSFVSFFICYAFYSAVFYKSDFYGAFPQVIGGASFNLGVLLITFAVMVPFGFIAALRFHCFPSLLQRWRQRLYMGRTFAVLRRQLKEGFDATS